MKRRHYLALALSVILTLCSGSVMASAATTPDSRPSLTAGLRPDPGAVPYLFNIERATLKNKNFRTAAWTGTKLQVTLMSIPPGGDVGLEMHSDIDQFLRIESGNALVMMGTAQNLSYVRVAGPGDVILIPSGTWHNIVNICGSPLKLYSLYGPPAHPRGTIHRTQADDPHSGEAKPSPQIGPVRYPAPFTADPGAVPFVFNVEDAVAANTNFRTAAWTADTLQLTLMNIPVGGDVGLERHGAVDQFLRIESGMAKVYMGTGPTADSMKLIGVAKAGDAILVPAGTWHNIVNVSHREPLKLYSIYGPQQHPKGTIHVTKPAE